MKPNAKLCCVLMQYSGCYKFLNNENKDEIYQINATNLINW